MNPKSITVRINSRGGDVFEGQAIYKLLLSLPAGVDVDVRIDGMAASIASLIAMPGPPPDAGETTANIR